MKAKVKRQKAKREDASQRSLHQRLMKAALYSLLTFAFCLFTFAFAASASAQEKSPPTVESKDADEVVVDGSYASDVFGLGRTVRVRGEVKNGALAFGGDVIIEGRVEGDVAAFGGSVVQLPGSYVGGDVMVIGGEYRHEGEVQRNPAGRTFLFAGYEQELRELARNPASILTPELSLSFLGWRLLAVLFWFAVSWALTSVSPGAVGRAAARLQLTLRHVALIGLVGAFVVSAVTVGSLNYLPGALSALVFVTATLLLLLSYLFGRVVVNAATGRWLQRVLLPEKRRSESVALLLGAAFWAVALALPYAWPFLVLGLVVISLGLSLTARYGLGRRVSQK
jgi:hypothetical protein